jgi:bifunctional non-homologous end joining protein LigD
VKKKAGQTLAAADYVEPMKALGVSELPGDDWLLEIKYDGFRALAILRDQEVELWSRNEKQFTSNYPEVVAALEKLACKQAVLDGEIVALDEQGRPRFQLLQGRGTGRRPPIFYYVFDLLHLDGKSFLDEPIEARRAVLEKLLKRAPGVIKLSPVFDVSADELLEQARQQGLEGIIGKRKGSRYEPGKRSGAWVKKRIATEQEFVVGGFTEPQGARTHFGALLVGYYEGEDLIYAGKVGTGFNSKSLQALHAQFKKRARADCPFVNVAGRARAGATNSKKGSAAPRYLLTAADQRGVTWLEPELVAQIKFSEWTRDGLLRQPVFLGLREDKRAREVVRETPSAAGG